MNQYIFGDELLKDEKILWEGQSDTSVIFTSSDVFLVPFSLLWGGFALFMAVMVATTSANSSQPGIALLPLIPFVLIGLYFMFGRFWVKALRKKNTYYAVTNKRLLSLTMFFGKRLDAMYINTIPSINKSIGSSGVGTLTFGNLAYPASLYANTGLELFGSYGSSGAVAFFDIKDAERVYQLISNMR